MIITCNCGEKKFSLPDNSIPVAGRMVQCGFCGIKWKQFPPQNLKEKTTIDKKTSVAVKKPITKIPKPKTKKVQKPREINLYSPEYLQKKHGISLNNVEINKKKVNYNKVSFVVLRFSDLFQ